MDAVEYLKEKNRMCVVFEPNCENCPLSFGDGCAHYNCDTEEGAKRIVSIVEQWSKDHPKKTRQSEFLKLFPNAEIDDSYFGRIAITPCTIDKNLYDGSAGVDCSRFVKFGNCDSCRQSYWSEEVE